MLLSTVLVLLALGSSQKCFKLSYVSEDVQFFQSVEIFEHLKSLNYLECLEESEISDMDEMSKLSYVSEGV